MPRPKLALLLTGGFVSFLIVLNVAVVAFHAVRARNQLNDARQTLQSARASISAGNLTEALTRVGGMHAKTAAAAASTSGSIWHFDEHLPFLGESLSSTRILAQSVNSIAGQALPGLTRSITSLKGGKLRNADGSLNLTLIKQTSSSLASTTAVLTRARAQVASLPAHPLISAVGNARTQLLGQIDGLLTDLNGASEAAKLAPNMLGANGPRKYFLALMNPAESRGAGGLVGTFGVVLADKGVLSLEKVGVDDDFPSFAAPVADISPDFTARWRPLDGDTDIRSSTDSPHFPWDAEVMSTMWRKRTGEQVDGVIAIDPAAAGSLVPLGHPLRLSDGTTLTGAELPTYVEQTLYAKFPDGDQRARKLELEDIERQLFQNLESGGNPEATLKALGHAAGERQLYVWSGHPDEQSILAATPLGGVMPDAPGPFIGVGIYNAIANKMDAYLQRTVNWTGGACPPSGSGRSFTTTVALDNQTPAMPLASEVAGVNAPGLSTRPPGSNRSWVSVYGSVGAVLTSVSLDGQPVGISLQSERSHPVVGLYVDLAPRQTRILKITWLDAPTIDTKGRSVALPAQAPFLQPLIKPAKVTANVGNCPS